MEFLKACLFFAGMLIAGLSILLAFVMAAPYVFRLITRIWEWQGV